MDFCKCHLLPFDCSLEQVPLRDLSSAESHVRVNEMCALGDSELFCMPATLMIKSNDTPPTSGEHLLQSNPSPGCPAELGIFPLAFLRGKGASLLWNFEPVG